MKKVRRFGASRIARASSIGRHRGVLKAKIAALSLWACLLPAPLAAQAVATDTSFIVDPLTGTALMGYDVVAYYIDDRAVQGDAGHQITHAGRAWYFSSLANRLAFESNPASFLPIFGGYDPAALAAGVIRRGDPRVFLRINERLYFFRDTEARNRVAANPTLLEDAEREWPGLKRDLDP